MTQQLSDNSLDNSIAAEGQQRIRWAQSLMPQLADRADAIIASGTLKNRSIGICLPIDAKGATLALALAEGGANVSCWAPAHYTDCAVAQSLRQQGISVFSSTEETAEFDNDRDSAHALLSSKPDIVVDHEAQITSLAAASYPEVLTHIKGITEASKTGIGKLRKLQKNGELNTVVVNLNQTRLNRLFNDGIGVGQSVVMAMLDVTNLQIAGRNVLVVGYGRVGRGIAAHAAALGARVDVAEIDPVKAMLAQYDGHVAKSISEASSGAEVVFTATGCAETLTAQHIEAMPDGVVLCSAGCGITELPMDYLEQTAEKTSVRAHVTNFQFLSGKNLLLVADGHCVNVAAGEGSPIEIVDKLMALQLASIELILTEGSTKNSDLESKLESIENAIALSHLDSSRLISK